MAKINDIKNIISQKGTAYEALQPSMNSIDGNTAKVIAMPDTNHDHQSNNLEQLINSFKEGIDWGYLPKVSGKVLFKNGAIKILRHFGYSYDVQMIDKTVSASDGLIAYTVKVTVIDKSGEIVARSLGSANSLEAKFSDRGMSTDNLLVGVASKRALVSAAKELIVQ